MDGYITPDRLYDLPSGLDDEILGRADKEVYNSEWGVYVPDNQVVNYQSQHPFELVETATVLANRLNAKFPEDKTRNWPLAQYIASHGNEFNQSVVDYEVRLEELYESKKGYTEDPYLLKSDYNEYFDNEPPNDDAYTLNRVMDELTRNEQRNNRVNSKYFFEGAQENGHADPHGGKVLNRKIHYLQESLIEKPIMYSELAIAQRSMPGVR